jgi:hypothetical protein
MALGDASSPFTPGVPVPVEFFVGRLAEVRRLNDKAAAAAAGRVEVAFLAGERGIGKSSLARYVSRLAEREHGMLCGHALLGGVTSLEEMARRSVEALIRDNARASWYEKLLAPLRNRIRQVSLFGLSVELDLHRDEASALARGFGPALLGMLEKLGGDRRGVLLVLDDINGLASERAFADWLKSLVDGLALSARLAPVCLVLVGLDEVRCSLVALQPSLGRVLDIVDIAAWSREETGGFITGAFDHVGIAVDRDARDLLCDYAGGLPALAHEIGDAAFRLDRDHRIDARDAMQSVLAAAETVGRKYVAPQVFKAIRSEKYRSILRRLAGTSLETAFRRADALRVLSDPEKKVFDNFLQKMRRLGAIARDEEGGPGAYRFTNSLHRLYFWMEAKRAAEMPWSR